MEQLSVGTTAPEPMSYNYRSRSALEPTLHNKSSHRKESPTDRN